MHGSYTRIFFSVVLLFGLAISGCAGSRGLRSGNPSGPFINIVVEGPYHIQPGDLLAVIFPYHPQASEQVRVRPDGIITLKVAGDFRAVGLTPEELGMVIKEKASVTLRDPVVRVQVAEFMELKVYVGGEVHKAGYVALRKGLTPLQAILERGGFTDTAKIDSVLLIRNSDRELTGTRIDLEKTLSQGATEDVTLSANDIVYVPRTAIGDANVWVRQHITDLLPVRGGAGLTFRPLD